jgi:hypothetical protein
MRLQRTHEAGIGSARRMAGKDGTPTPLDDGAQRTAPR